MLNNDRNKKVDSIYNKGLELISVKSRVHEIEEELCKAVVKMALERGFEFKETDISNIFVRIDNNYNKVIDFVYRQSSAYTFKIKEAELETAYVENEDEDE
jgi:hypothetical protein